MWWSIVAAAASASCARGQCPNCGLRLRFGRENLPLLGWLLLRGRCRQCRLAIPLRYLLMEWGVAFAFVGVYQLAFDPFGCGGTMDPWLEATGARESAFYFLGVLADVGLLCRGGYRLPHIPHPHVDHDGTGDKLACPPTGSGVGGSAATLGDGCSPFLFRMGRGGFSHRGALGTLGQRVVVAWCAADFFCRLRRVRGGWGGLGGISACSTRDGERTGVLLDHRGGFAIGGLFTKSFQHSGDPPVWLAAASAGVIGWASGAAVVWLVRIGGTVWLGQEAMGLGDVHLMGGWGVVGLVCPASRFCVGPFCRLVLVERLGGGPKVPRTLVGGVAAHAVRPAFGDCHHGGGPRTPAHPSRVGSVVWRSLALAAVKLSTPRQKPAVRDILEVQEGIPMFNIRPALLFCAASALLAGCKTNEEMMARYEEENLALRGELTMKDDAISSLEGQLMNCESMSADLEEQLASANHAHRRWP